MSEARRGERNGMWGKGELLSGEKNGMWGRTHSEEAKEKIRQKAIDRFKKTGMLVTIGKNEEYLLNKQAEIDNCIILRQIPIYIDTINKCYQVDGYCVDTNTVYEVYEREHYMPKNIKKDLIRQQHIQDKLNCKFIIIKDDN